MSKKSFDSPPIVSREFGSVKEIEFGISKLRRRIQELEQLNMAAAILDKTGADEVAKSNVCNTIREVFGTNSPEFDEHQYIGFCTGVIPLGESDQAKVNRNQRGCQQAIVILNGLIGRLEEKKEDLGRGSTFAAPATYFDSLNLHPRILEVSRDLFFDGHHWEAVFAASKALLNYVKERSGCHDLDGAKLVRKAFTKNNPVLVFNELSDQTEVDEQEGMMHLFEGAVLGIRNPGGHSFPEGTEQRAVEYISLLSLLAYRTQEAKRRKDP